MHLDPLNGTHLLHVRAIQARTENIDGTNLVLAAAPRPNRGTLLGRNPNINFYLRIAAPGLQQCGQAAIRVFQDSNKPSGIAWAIEHIWELKNIARFIGHSINPSLMPKYVIGPLLAPIPIQVWIDFLGLSYADLGSVLPSNPRLRLMQQLGDTVNCFGRFVMVDTKLNFYKRSSWLLEQPIDLSRNVRWTAATLSQTFGLTTEVGNGSHTTPQRAQCSLQQVLSVYGYQNDPHQLEIIQDIWNGVLQELTTFQNAYAASNRGLYNLTRWWQAW